MIYNDTIEGLHLEASHLCNASCPGCARGHSGWAQNPNIRKSYITYEQSCQWFPTEFITKLKKLILCGNYGDPLTNPDVVKILSRFRKYSPDIEITLHTNASGRASDWWIELGHVIGNKGRVYFSVDGLEDTNHIYRRDTHWNLIMNSMKAYISTGANATWDFLIFDHNKHQVEEAEQLSKKLGFKTFNKKYALGFTPSENNKVIPMSVYDKKGNFEYYIKSADKETDENYQADQFRELVFEQELFNPDLEDLQSDTMKNLEQRCITCYASKFKDLYVDANGLVFPCCWVGSQIYANMTYTSYQVKQLIKNCKDQIDLNKTTLDQVLQHDIFTRTYQKTFNTTSIKDGRLIVCSTMCGKGNEMDTLFESMQ